jgi:hypothetical protein
MPLNALPAGHLMDSQGALIQHAITALRKAEAQLLHALDELFTILPEGIARTEVYNQRKRVFQSKAIQYERLVKCGVANESLASAVDQVKLCRDQQESATKIFEAHWQAVLAQSSELVLEQYQQSQTFRRGLVATGSDITSIDYAPDAKFYRTLYTYLSRASMKTSPLSTLGTVHYLHHAYGQVMMPWESAVERFWPSLQTRSLFYYALERSDAYLHALKYRMNPSASLSADKLDWLVSHEVGEVIESAELQNSLSQFVEIASHTEPQTLKDWAKSLKAYGGHEFVEILLNAGLLLRALPEGGVEGNWAKTLLNYLAFLGSQAPQEEINMLNLLTKAAGQFPHMEAEFLANCLAEVHQQLQATGATIDIEFVDIRPSDLYSHDVHTMRDISLHIEDFQDIASEIKLAISELGGFPLDIQHLRMLRFADECAIHPNALPNGQNAWPFLVFARAFLNSTWTKAKVDDQQRGQGLEPWPVAAVIQCFREGNETLKAVINGLSPGGGRMSGRYLTMFPDQITSEIREWNRNFEDDQRLAVAFRHISPSNANIHQLVTPWFIDWPEWEGTAPKAGGIPLSDIGVRRVDSTHLGKGNCLCLVQMSSGKDICLFEYGLEARHEKSPLAQLLLSIGIPNWTTSLWQDQQSTETRESGIGYRPRLSTKQSNLVIRRAEWEVPVPKSWEKLKGHEFALEIMHLAGNEGMPPEMFYKMDKQSKPQYFNLNEPLSQEVLRANLSRYKPQKVVFTEMLPTPSQAVADSFVSEFVLELMV